jgi:N-acetylglucosamine-6-phosphate deacetylase
MTVLHGATQIDGAGVVTGAWVRFIGDRIERAGIGGPPPAADGEDAIDLAGHLLVPGFIDLHAHGAGGSAYDDGADAMRAGIVWHRGHGTTRSLISLVTHPTRSLADNLRAAAEVADGDPSVLGIHLEDPFLSPAKPGSHEVSALRHPDDPDVVRALIDAAGGHLAQITIAPELPGAMTAIDLLVAAGVRVAVGHTDCTFDEAREAFARGASLLTHAFSAMRPLHHREPGALLAAIESNHVTLEVLVDGIHLHPAIVRMLFALAPQRIALVTDAMAGAGLGDGTYRLGGFDVDVIDGAARVEGTDTLAGATVFLDDALRIAVTFGVPLEQAIPSLTGHAAAALSMDEHLGRLAPGFAADFVVLDSELRIVAIWAAGKAVRPLDSTVSQTGSAARIGDSL